MKLRKDLKLFAIGGRGFIEFRAARVAPKAHTTSHEKIIPYEGLVRVPAGVLDPGAGHVYVRKTLEKKHVLKITTWTGGRVLGSLPPREANGRVSVDTVVPVPEKFVEKILKRLEERSA